MELTEINNFFNDVMLDEEKTEKVIDFLESKGVDVLRIPEGKETDEDIMLEMENSDDIPDDEEIEKITFPYRKESVLKIRFVCI